MWFIILLICVFMFSIISILLCQTNAICMNDTVYSLNTDDFNFYDGGYSGPERSIIHKNIIVDTLNMTYEIHKKSNNYRIKHDDILNTIRLVTNKLKPFISDKIIFVTKMNEKHEQHDFEIQSFHKMSKELKVYIYIVNKLKEPGINTYVRIKKSHATLGRDDFYIILMAWKLRCPVLGQDYYRDLRGMKYGELDSFFVDKYSPFKQFSERDYINPKGHEYTRMRAPRVIRWDSL